MLELKCLIVEDEVLAANILADYVAQTPGLKLTGVCDDALSALEKLNSETVDIIFLDINLPKINGLEFIKTLNDKYHVIITTAYHQYAVEGFELDVVDYLLKPISLERFLKAVNKVMEYQALVLRSQEAGAGSSSFLFVKTSNGLEKVNFQEIIFIESLQNYIVIHKQDHKIITHSSLKNIEQFLPASKFVKVQKSFIINIEKIDRIDGNMIIMGKHSISISRANKDKVLNQIINDRILKR